ncbi:hypothetical protein COCNU_10G009330 [Cocos nucifera]|uniref:Uncharacterized protein n=1 Tax=Cocos nucifera TaxID=13894 RepID=A0A8K0IN00_COCNU|nr:hypothetical protein COCNU_10G009330 [Cocos nucifera]
MINRILDYFIIFEGLDKAEVIRRTKYVIRRLSDQYREYRNELYKVYKNRHKDPRKLKCLLDKVITKDDWDWLVAHWNDENFQKMSKTNAENRSKYNMVPCTSRTAFSVVEQRLTQAANGVRPSRLEMFEKIRTYARLKELQQQCNEGDISLDDEEIFMHVFGPNKRGLLLCKEMGPTQSILRSIQAQKSKTMFEEAMKRAENTEIRIEQTEKRAETTELRLEAIEKELHDIEEKSGDR